MIEGTIKSYKDLVKILLYVNNKEEIRYPWKSEIPVEKILRLDKKFEKKLREEIGGICDNW